MSNDYDYSIKALFCGKSSIGKTMFGYRLTKEYLEFLKIPKDYCETIGFEFFQFNIKINDKIIRYQIWDTCDNEIYKSLVANFYRNCEIFIIFYDHLDRESFEEAKLYYNNFKTNYIENNPICILVSSKYDINLKSEENKNIVSEEEVLEFVDENDIFFFHISSFEKYETGINELLTFISIKCLKPLKGLEHLKEKHCKVKKPVIYLYPEKSMDISVQLNIKKSKLTTIYPKFNQNNNTWKVYVNANGEIKIRDKIYPYLFWESESYFINEINEGFIVKDENAEEFLEEKLKILGLNNKESTDFITFWLPVLLKNKLSLCYFQSEEYFENYELNINPKPDSLIRIFLSIKKINSPIKIKEQKLTSNERKGFTVVEWGGTNI